MNKTSEGGSSLKILNFGSMNIDYLYEADHIAAPGETVRAFSRKRKPGGKGLNQSVALSRAGVFCYHAGNVGLEAEMLLDELADANVDTTFVRRLKDTPTGHTVIQIDREGQNAILVFGGANLQVTKEQIDETLSFFGEGDLLLLQNEINGLQDIMAAANNRGMRIIFNPSPIDDDIVSLPFETVDTLVLNELEAAALTGLSPDQHSAMLQALLETYPDCRIVLTLGPAGAMYADASDRFRIDAVPSEVVDTTGAGDTFLGYYVAGIVEGMSAEESIILANKAASLAVSRSGAAPSIPFRAEVDQL